MRIAHLKNILVLYFSYFFDFECLMCKLISINMQFSIIYLLKKKRVRPSIKDFNEMVRAKNFN